jgi:hypothetical protein
MSSRPVCLQPVLAAAAFLAAPALLLALIKFWPVAEPQYPDYGDLMHFDPAREGGHLRPYLDLLVVGERVGHPVRFVTNSKGFRSAREFPQRSPAGRRRVLFVGDSLVDGMRTDQEDTIGFQLEALLDASDADGPSHDVLIAGSNNPANAWYYFQEHGHRYDPDLVLFGLTLGNDLTWHNYRGGLAPERGADGSMRLALVPPPRQDARRRPYLMLPASAYLPPDRLEGLVDLELRRRHSLARRFHALAQHVPPIVAPGRSARRSVPAAGFMTSLGLFYMPLMDEIAEMHADLDAVLNGLAAEVARHGSRLAVVLFPVRIQVSERDWWLLQRASSLDSARFDLDAPNRRILASCRRGGLDCLDLLPAFRAAHARGEGPFFRPRGDMHFNAAGQAFGAARIADHLIQR